MLHVETLRKRLSDFGYDAKAEDNVSMTFCLEKVSSTIKNRIHGQDVPEGLEHIAIDMAAGEFLQAQKTFAPETLAAINLDSAVKQIKVGDTDTTFAIGQGSQTPEQRLDALISHLLNYGKDEILSFRKLQW